MQQPRVLALLGGAALFGQERGNIEALLALKAQGCEVLCLIRDDDWNTFIPEALDIRGLAWKRIPYIEHRMPGRLRQFLFRNPVAFLRANWRFMKIAREFRPTSIHAPNPLYVINFLVALLRLPIPMVYRAGDEPTVHNWFWRAIWRFVVWRTSAFVANSHFVARSLMAHGVAQEDITVIYNSPPQRIQRTEKGRTVGRSKTFEILYVGQVSEHKGVGMLIDAFRSVADEFPTAELVIAGRVSAWSGDAWGRQLRDQTKLDPVIGARVRFLGDTDEIPLLLARCSLHVAPSLFDDPAPNVLAEAKAAGRASVVFRKGGMPELVEDGVDGVVCQDVSVDSLASALRGYLADPERAATHGAAARESLVRLGIPSFPQRWLEVHRAVS